MDSVKIERTMAFLREKLGENPWFREHPHEGAYRLEHSIRVANIGRKIALAEGFDVTEMVAACLLHDVSYCRHLVTNEDGREHGREAARIARPFLLRLGFPEDRVEDMCFGIAIHVDDEADFPGERTAFARSVGDADNIDRFDAYRIYEGLQFDRFSELPLPEKRERVRRVLTRLEALRAMDFATSTATALWREKLDFYRDFYLRLSAQLDHSEFITD